MAIETLPFTPAATTIDPMIAFAQEFTDCYRAHATAHRAVREAMCLRVQFPRLLRDLAAEDTFAGRVPKPALVAFSHHIWGTFPERTSAGKQGGYCFDFGASERAGRTAAEQAVVRELEAFWATECGNAKFRAKWDSEMHTYVQFAASDTPTGHLPGGGFMVGGGSNGCSITLEFGRLLRGGIPGLVALVAAKRADVLAAGGDTGFHDGLALALDLLVEVCGHYERQARDLAAAADAAGAADAATRERMLTVADVMSAITQRPPCTLREALQLAWMYTIVNADLAEFPRFDELFGGFYAHDIDSGVCTQQEADDLLAALWAHMARDGSPFSDRIVVGGRGRVNEPAADRLALAVLRTARAHRDVTPQFTMRHCQGQAPELMAAALDALGDGCSFPLLYNDDAILPGVERSLNVSPEMALRYHPFGCGEYTLAGGSPTPILVGFNVPKALEAVLHNGRNVHGELIGLATGELGEFDTFERLYQAFERQTEFALGLAAKTYRHVYAALAEECSFLLASLLTDDCLERGRAALDGGLHRMGACVVGQGYTNAADALTAIRELVYERRTVTLAQLVAALDADYQGHEALRAQLWSVAKFGNDDAAADAMFARVWDTVHSAAHEAAPVADLDYLIVSSVNPGGFDMGVACGATADGRGCGQPFAIGTAPTAGRDTSGLTALFNSLTHIGSMNGGATTNLKISREYFTEQRHLLSALLEVFFDGGGLQASVTSVGRDELLDAQLHPERNAHVLVRVGGFTARYVELDPVTREEILARTLY